jgi:hypothetical protein
VTATPTTSLGERAARGWLTLRVYALVLLMQPLLRFDLSWLLHRLDATRRDVDIAASDAATLAPLVTEAIGRLRPLITSVCLTRTFTLFVLLRRQGVPLEVHLGVDHDSVDRGASFRAHCWLVHEQQPLFERSDPRERYSTVYRYCSGSERQIDIPVEVREEAARDVMTAGHRPL